MTAATCPLAHCQIVGTDEPPVPMCTLATNIAVSRKSQLDECAALALDGINQPHLASAVLKTIADRASSEDVTVEVPDGELLVAITRALEQIVSAEPSALVEQAVAIRDVLAHDGWLVVRAEGCLS